MDDSILAAVAAFVAVPTVLDFLSWSGPIAMATMQLMAVALPVAVAAPTGSMQPTMDGGDRLVHDAGAGEVQRGDVIVYTDGETDYAHRAQFHVDAGENWYDRANPAFIDADSCEELRNCPAPQSGWITKGDANPEYDQSAGRHGVVSPGDVEGRVLFVVDNQTWQITRLST